MHRLPILLLTTLLAAAPPALAGEAPGADDRRFGRGRLHLGFSTGWGQGYEPGSHPQDEVRMLAFVPSLGVGLTDPLGGEAWYAGNLDLSIEPQFLVDLSSGGGFAGGTALLLRYQLLGLPGLVPFVSVGAGMAGVDFDGTHQDDGFNFILQAGAGAHLLLTERTALSLDARWHHLSNAGTRSPNSGIDSALVLVGATWFF